MKLALYGLHRGSSVDPARLAARAARAEAVGFEGLWVGDHIALPVSAPDPADEPRLEALVALSFLAAATTTIGLGVGVLIAPQRQPVLAAKQLASIDVLSGGRLTVGIGVGYVEPELEALGASLRNRGAMTDEHVAAMRALWAQQDEPFTGQWASFAGVLQSPPPAQRPGPPIVVGGHAPAALRRAAAIGDGWFGWALDVGETTDALAHLARACEAVGRDPADLEITITPPRRCTLADVEQYAAVGVDRLVLQPESFAGDEIDELTDYAATELLDVG
jgi:probable F420-dependent oxidoreductase